MVLLKILEIMKSVTHIGKDTKIKFGQVDYPALTETHLLEVIRPEILKAGIVAYPTEVTHLEVNGKLTTIGIRYVVRDVKEGDEVIVASVGQGQDSGDKGAGKAATYANKYMWLKLLQLAQKADDPDLISSEELSANEEAIKVALTEARKMLNKIESKLEEELHSSLDQRLDDLSKRCSLKDAEKALAYMKKLAKENS